MKATDLIGDGGCNAFAALHLLDLIAPFFRDENEETENLAVKKTVLNTSDLFQSPELVILLENEDPVDLLKGLCFVMFFSASHWLCKDGSPVPVFQAMRQSADDYMTATGGGEDDHALDSQYRALSLLDAIEGGGGSFFLIAHSLATPFEEILSLSSMFCNIARENVGREPYDLTGYIRRFIEMKLG